MKKTNLMLVAGLLAFSGMAMAQGQGHGINDDGYPGASCSVGNAVFCEGEDGEIYIPGPQGPKGDTGERGPAGEDGADGVDGERGPARESYDPEFIAELNKRIRENNRDIAAGVAGAYASTSHQFDVYGDAQLSIAGGFYEGENAVSVAYGRAINEEVFIHGNVTQDSQGNTGGALGVTFQLN